MRHLHITFLLLLAQALAAQFLPFQGKVFDADDQPLTGQHAFQFSITDGGVNWTETHPAVTVYQGIYAVVLGSQTTLPDGVFANSAMHTLQVQMDGTPLADVMLYRPIENDPKLPDELRDGVDWVDIKDPPPLAGGATVPIGTILPYGGLRNSIPAGWLECDGQAISRTEYAELLTATGGAWGLGDGIATFNVPDLRGQFLRGVDTGTGTDTGLTDRTRINGAIQGTEWVGSYQTDLYQAHSHNLGGYGLVRQSQPGEGVTTNGVDAGRAGVEPDVYNATQNMPNSGGPETRPKNAAVYYIIKVQ